MGIAIGSITTLRLLVVMQMMLDDNPQQCAPPVLYMFNTDFSNIGNFSLQQSDHLPPPTT